MDAYIRAISYYLPSQILTNEQIAQEFPEWSIEKIYSKLGIKERHISNENETASDMAVCAAEKLFQEYSLDKNEIDYLILCTQSPDYFLPTTACVIQAKLGLNTSIGAVDINLGCSGWLYGLSLAKGLLLGGMAKNVLLLTSETYSKYLHPQDKGNRTIFGDGAAATLVSLSGFASIGEFSLGTDGTGAENLIVKTGASRYKYVANDLSFDDFGNPKSSDYLYMDGSAILNYTLDRIPEMVADTLEKNKLDMDKIDLHVFHQANKYIATLQRKKMKIPQERYYCFYENVGNTVSSTIPIAIKEAILDGSINEGYKVLSVAQGLGYSWGGVVLNFNF